MNWPVQWANATSESWHRDGKRAEGRTLQTSQKVWACKRHFEIGRTSDNRQDGRIFSLQNRFSTPSGTWKMCNSILESDWDTSQRKGLLNNIAFRFLAGIHVNVYDLCKHCRSSIFWQDQYIQPSVVVEKPFLNLSFEIV